MHLLPVMMVTAYTAEEQRIERLMIMRTNKAEVWLPNGKAGDAGNGHLTCIFLLSCTSYRNRLSEALLHNPRKPFKLSHILIDTASPWQVLVFLTQAS